MGNRFMAKNLFRKQAIEAAGRVDDIQRTMRVTRSATRMSTAAVAITICAVVVWSAMVDVPIHVEGNGLMVQSGGILITSAPAVSAGYVAYIDAQSGDSVKAGQVLARLDLTDQQTNLSKVERDLSLLKQNIELKEELIKADTDAKLANTQKRADALQERLGSLTAKRDWLRERQNKMIGLQTKGVVSLEAASNARLAADASEDALTSARAEQIGLKADAERIRSALEQQKLEDKLALAKLQAEYDAAKQTLDNDSKVVASVAGRIIRVNARSGVLVAAGEPLFEIMPQSDGPLKAMVYVPLSEGKRLRRHDKALLTPANMPLDMHAQLRGEVLDISSVPVTAESLKQSIGDDTLADHIAAQGPMFEVSIALDEDNKHKGGYQWTSDLAETISLSAGTPLSARVTVEKTPLLALALPAVKRFFGESPNKWSGR
ncbi:NHLP bacteriocin system secretion protein [Cohaesibacter celericrescens]|uniref:NHLP bacteriocin system secretion protein n=2 Tax=Cohaesibacter celericrescens TaxID=2067669 RepID=A0A2N5XRS2_9HYPH|nr:NHLP bacteriocin system secretion protein [Cohaesibacter celericrescens]